MREIKRVAPRGEFARWLPYWRWLPLAAVVLFLGGVTVVLGVVERDPQFWSSGRIWDWAIGLASGAMILLGGRWPLGVLIAQCSLLALATRLEPFFGYGHLAPVAADTIGWLAAVSLCELVYRRRDGAVLLGVVSCFVLFAVVYSGPELVGAVTTQRGVEYDFRPWALSVETVLQQVIRIGGPVVVGLLLRRSAQLVRLAEGKAQTATDRLEVSEANEVRAVERAAIARELHDLVAHHIASIVLRVGAAHHAAQNADPKLREVLDDVRGTGLAVLDDLRRLVTVLRDPGSLGDAVLVDPADLLEELNLAIDRARQAGVDVDTDVDPRITELEALRRVAVLRIVQESLANVLKHAGTTSTARVTVQVDTTGGALVDVRNGGGRSASPTGRPGHGMSGMAERAELVGGSLSAGPEGDGWRVTARLPAPPTREVPA